MVARTVKYTDRHIDRNKLCHSIKDKQVGRLIVVVGKNKDFNFGRWIDCSKS